LILELAPLEDRFDTDTFQQVLTSFNELAAETEPQELQRMLRLM
jgi:hypothetical protein